MDSGVLEKVISPDGTPIAYHRSGSGPPLVLVPGASGSNPVNWTVFPALAQHFTVYAVDRRGHGASGDSPTYAIEREFDDIAAVVDALDEPANLLGHSFGGLCALEAARLTHNLHRLVVYEGFLLPQVIKSMNPEGYIDRLEELLEAGDREGLLTLFYRTDVGMSPEQLEGFKSSPAWPERLAAAQTLPRELHAVAEHRFDPQRFKQLQAPTLLLLGGSQPEYIKESTRYLHANLPNSRIAELPGQQHIAMYTAPELFLQAVLAFLTG